MLTKLDLLRFKYLLDQLVRWIISHFAALSAHRSCSSAQPPPSSDDDEFVKKLRQRLKDLLENLRAGAEGTIKD